MILKKIRNTLLLVIILFLLFKGGNLSFSQTESPTPSPDNTQAAKDLQDKINSLQGKINDLQSQEKTLSSQIAVMDNQVKLTEYKIQSTEEQIVSITLDIDTATKKIGSLQKELDNSIQVLLNRIVATYEVGSMQPLQILVTSGNASDFLKRLNYLKLAQAHDKKLIYDTQQAKVDYANQKAIFEDEKKKIEALQKQLEDYTVQLAQQKKEKQTLLSQTQGSEANYQSLLSQAKAQLAGFSRFATSQGGASILSNQTSCDDWGCYYNQRDSQWGNVSLNNTQYSIASDGCLVTAMAMVYTHIGRRGVTPLSINSNPSNFASYYPAFLNKTIVADGMTTGRVSSQIDSELSQGKPVVVGINAYGGTHFVVLISGSGGSYTMNDPFIANGNKISFNAHYSVGSIYEIDRISY